MFIFLFFVSTILISLFSNTYLSWNPFHPRILHHTVRLPRLNVSRVLFGFRGYTGLWALSRIWSRLKVMASLWTWSPCSVFNSNVELRKATYLTERKLIVVSFLSILNPSSSYSTLTTLGLLVCIRNNTGPVYQFVFEPENCLSSMFWPKTVCTPYAWTERNYAGAKITLHVQSSPNGSIQIHSIATNLTQWHQYPAGHAFLPATASSLFLFTLKFHRNHCFSSLRMRGTF